MYVRFLNKVNKTIVLCNVTYRGENGRTRARAAVPKRRVVRRSSDESDEESSGTDDAPPGPEPAPREWGAPWASSLDSST